METQNQKQGKPEQKLLACVLTPDTKFQVIQVEWSAKSCSQVSEQLQLLKWVIVL